MKRIFSLALIFALFSFPAFADQTPFHHGASVTDALTTHAPSKGVWVGVTQSIDLYLVEGWITFKGATANTVIPVAAVGARKTAGGTAPDAGDIIFLA